MGGILRFVYDDWDEVNNKPIPNGYKLYPSENGWENAESPMNGLNYKNFINCRIEDVLKYPDENFYYIIWARPSITYSFFTKGVIPISNEITNMIREYKNLYLFIINDVETEPKEGIKLLEELCDVYKINPKKVWFVNNNSRLTEYKNELNSKINVFSTQSMGRTFWTETKIQFIPNKEDDSLFLCQNHTCKSHRVGLLILLKKYGILNDTDWSYLTGWNSPNLIRDGFLSGIFTPYDIDMLRPEIEFFQNIETYRCKHEKNDTWYNRYSKESVPWSKLFNPKTMENSYFNIASETWFNTHDVHITEKTFKPFFYYQFPIIVASHHHIKFFKELYDFDFFDDVINHDYDNIINDRDRLFKLVEEIKRIQENKEFFISFYKNNTHRFIENHKKIFKLTNVTDHTFLDSLITNELK